ncbi:MAG: adenylyltransferase/cytidyltransferase family protein [Elusimicrobiota bacterium]|nr:adenylyltransferase/cytidyltransferase family protein [Elusimicrobiota bacterium]
MKPSSAKILPLKKLLTLRELWRWEGRKVVFTNGVYDILHPGHVKLLEKARSLGDLLILGLNTDASARRLDKAPGRPVNALRDRMAVTAALGCVDAVVAFDEDTPERLLSRLKPDVLVNGGAYRPDQVAGRAHAGRVVIVALKKGHSTTGLIKRLQGRR